VATPAAQLGRSATRERVLEVIRGLLEELGSQGALPILSASSPLDRDLGLGSLERVELLARLETAFGMRLPDRVASEANTPDDLARVILSSPGTIAEEEEAGSALRASVTVQKLHRAATDEGVFVAETLIDVLRYRATHDADRDHLLITEDSDAGERSYTLTFGELYAAGNRCAAELARRGVAAGGRVALLLHVTGSRARQGSDIALLQYTSGSTGDPKGVMLTHANLLANMRAIGEAVQIARDDVGVSWLPLYHDMGLIGAWLTLLHF